MPLTAQNARKLHSTNYSMLPTYSLISNKALLFSFTLHIQSSKQSSSSHSQGITMTYKCYRIILTLKALIYTCSPKHRVTHYDDMIANTKAIALCLCAYWWSIWPHILQGLMWGWRCVETVYCKKENTGAGCLDDTVQLHQKSKGNVGFSAMLRTAKYSPNWVKRELIPQQVNVTWPMQY